MNFISNFSSATALGAGLTNTAAQPAPELAVVIPTYNECSNIPLLVERLRTALVGYDWEVIIVDDNSPDGTSEVACTIGESDRRVRCIRRIGRRGLSGACLEGMLASQAQFLAVMDGDLQHDETLLRVMLERLRSGAADLVVATRYSNGAATDGFTSGRAQVSRWSTALAQRLLRVRLSDPMSGFFMIRRAKLQPIVPSLSSQGFKILLDIILSARCPLRVMEVPYQFRQRLHGQSKLDAKNAIDFAALLISKLTYDAISYRFLLFCVVGLTGIAVHLLLLKATLQTIGGHSFLLAQVISTIGATTWNFVLNNMITYHDQRLSGWRFARGIVWFHSICAVGTISNIGVAAWFYNAQPDWWLAGLLGALMSAVWNYVASSVFVWRA